MVPFMPPNRPNQNAKKPKQSAKQRREAEMAAIRKKARQAEAAKVARQKALAEAGQKVLRALEATPVFMRACKDLSLDPVSTFTKHFKLFRDGKPSDLKLTAGLKLVRLWAIDLEIAANKGRLKFNEVGFWAERIGEFLSTGNMKVPKDYRERARKLKGN